MKSLTNSVQLIGRLGTDVDYKESEKYKLAKISLATSEIITKANGDKDQNTQWHNLIAWGKQAELLSILCKKGTQIAVQGKLQYGDYLNKEGNKVRYTNIRINDFMVLSGKIAREREGEVATASPF